MIYPYWEFMGPPRLDCELRRNHHCLVNRNMLEPEDDTSMGHVQSWSQRSTVLPLEKEDPLRGVWVL